MTALPLVEAWQMAGVDLAVGGVDARHVDSADELDRGRDVGVLRAAVHLEGVDAVLVDALEVEKKNDWISYLTGCQESDRVTETYVGRADDGAGPVRHEQIFGIFQTVGAGLCLSSVSSPSLGIVQHSKHAPLAAGMETHPRPCPSRPSLAPQAAESFWGPWQPL